jgi:DNA-binding transcriptional regulator YdaS (Cro superfamily)
MPCTKPLKPEKQREAFKNIDRLALRRIFNISSAMASQIARGHIQVSPKRALEMEQFLGIPKEILRPDIFKTNGKKHKKG